MRRALISALAIVIAVATASSPAVAAPSFDLVPPLTCLAGDWGHSTPQWRVQLGVFADHDRAAAFEQTLAARGMVAERYIGAWLDPDLEPLVVVSRAYRTRAAAERAARRFRRISGDALVREFTVWSR